MLKKKQNFVLCWNVRMSVRNMDCFLSNKLHLPSSSGRELHWIPLCFLPPPPVSLGYPFVFCLLCELIIVWEYILKWKGLELNEGNGKAGISGIETGRISRGLNGKYETSVVAGQNGPILVKHEIYLSINLSFWSMKSINLPLFFSEMNIMNWMPFISSESIPQQSAKDGLAELCIRTYIQLPICTSLRTNM